MNKLLKIVKDPLILFAWLLRHFAPLIKNDELYLRMLYFLSMKKKLNLNPPITFNEKLQWLKLHDKRDEYTMMVDKAEVKNYVAEIIGKEYIIPTIGIWNNFDDIDFKLLPDQFVLKCTHDSGGVVICKDKQQLNIAATRKKINGALKRNFFYMTREYPYKDVKPRIIAEKYMMDESENNELLDYKVMLFNGKTKNIFVCSNRTHSKGLCVDFYDTQWNHLPFQRHYRNNPDIIKQPSQLKKIICLSEMIAGNIKAPFVRIDFYQVSDHPYFGEITFFPGNGMEEFTPEEWDHKLGEYIKLPKE